MKIEKMKWITREIVRANPYKVFLFGDNLQRFGLGGQAKQMRGEPNAVGVAVKRMPNVDTRSYFNDAELEDNCDIIANDILRAIDMAHALSGVIVIPVDGIGTGLAELDKRAPRTFDYLQTKLSELETI